MINKITKKPDDNMYDRLPKDIKDSIEDYLNYYDASYPILYKDYLNYYDASYP